MIQECSKCHTIKDLRCFYKFKDMKNGYRNECKECTNSKSKLNKLKRGKAYNNEKSRQYRATNRKRILAYYGGSLICEHCGIEDKCFSVYDFHHVIPASKEQRIGVLINGGWTRIEKELNKCIVLCANCHRKEHNCEED